MDETFKEQCAFRITWSMVILISHIDRFDAKWETLKVRELELLGNISLHSFADARKDFLNYLDNCEDNIKPIILSEFQQLVFWYETDLEMHLLTRCIFFAYHFKNVLNLANLDVDHFFKMMSLLLFESGYDWINYLNLDDITSINCTCIIDWTISALSLIRDAQQMLLAKIDLYGNGSRLTKSEKLLVHVIDTNADITTHRIAKKIGRSEATIRRMLTKLRELKIITTQGSGPRVFHSIVM